MKITVNMKIGFPAWLAENGIERPVFEYTFHSDRLWRFDFAWPDHKVALEVEGGVRQGISRHTNYDGFVRDCDKYNCAIIHGWKLLRVVPQEIYTIQTAMMCRSAIDDLLWTPAKRPPIKRNRKKSWA